MTPPPQALLEGSDENADVPENQFVEAILDNVVGP